MTLQHEVKNNIIEIKNKQFVLYKTGAKTRSQFPYSQDRNTGSYTGPVDSSQNLYTLCLYDIY